MSSKQRIISLDCFAQMTAHLDLAQSHDIYPGSHIQSVVRSLLHNRVIGVAAAEGNRHCARHFGAWQLEQGALWAGNLLCLCQTVLGSDPALYDVGAGRILGRARQAEGDFVAFVTTNCSTDLSARFQKGNLRMPIQQAGTLDMSQSETSSSVHIERCVTRANMSSAS